MTQPPEIPPDDDDLDDAGGENPPPRCGPSPLLALYRWWRLLDALGAPGLLARVPILGGQIPPPHRPQEVPPK